MRGVRAESDFARLRTAVGYIFDPKTGVIGDIREHDRAAGAPEYFRYIATAGDTAAFSGHHNFAIGGGAASLRDEALAKAIGEAIERYCAAVYDRRDFVFSTQRAADFDCVDPADFALYDERQYAEPGFIYQPFHADSEVRWMPVRSLVGGTIRYVPACMVYLPYLFQRDGDEWPLSQSISTGLSCHESFAKAALGGVNEVIERDCFSITWQAQVQRTRIALDSLPLAARQTAGRFVRAGYRCHVMDISHDNEVPTLLSVLRGEGPGTAPLAVAAAADLSPIRALTKCFEELAHTERYVRQLMGELPRIQIEADHRNVYSQVSHVNFWISPERAQHADFLHASPREIDFTMLPDRSTGDAERDLATVTRLVAGTGHDVLVADVTTPDIAMLGFSVVRALIPGYHPLFMGYECRALGGERLWSVPQKLGFEGVTRLGGDNPMPHPFP